MRGLSAAMQWLYPYRLKNRANKNCSQQQATETATATGRMELKARWNKVVTGCSQQDGRTMK